VSKWRPEGWSETVREIREVEEGNTDHIIEAAADAMLEALRKRGIHVTDSPWMFTRRNEAGGYQFIGEDTPGVITIIPDEEER